MKFLMSSLGENDDGTCAQDSYIDCCVGSPSMLMRFLRLIMEEWGLKSAASLAYMQAITDLCDFRKRHGVEDCVDLLSQKFTYDVVGLLFSARRT